MRLTIPDNRRVVIGAILFLMLVALAACGHLEHRKRGYAGLGVGGWRPENRAALERFIAAYDQRGGEVVFDSAPVAIFDWDNTVIKNDIGDAMLLWMLDHDRILQPPNGDWTKTSQWLTAEAAEALKNACSGVSPGLTLPTSRNQACFMEILHIYATGRTTHRRAAFAGYSPKRLQPSYAWAVQLQAGYSALDIRRMAKQAIAEKLEAKEGRQRVIGDIEFADYIRIYPAMQELIAEMRAAGFEVWVLSASAQPVVEMFAARLGIPAERVIGVRSLSDGDGVLGYRLTGCGDAADGSDAIMPYREGKRCFMNREIFGIENEQALYRTKDMNKRPVFAAGDSDTDVDFMRDATGLRLAIDRHKPELSCRALYNPDRRWLLQPMFIEPMPARGEPYPCASSACIDQDGRPIACTHEGVTIPDQQPLL